MRFLLFCQIWLKIASGQCVMMGGRGGQSLKKELCSLTIWCLCVIEQTWLRRGLPNFCASRNKPIREKSPLPSFLLQCHARPFVNAYRPEPLLYCLWVWLEGSPGVTNRVFHSGSSCRSRYCSPEWSLECSRLPSPLFWSYTSVSPWNERMNYFPWIGTFISTL